MTFPKILQKLQKSLDSFLPNIKSEAGKSYHLSIPKEFEVMDDLNPAELITLSPHGGFVLQYTHSSTVFSIRTLDSAYIEFEYVKWSRDIKFDYVKWSTYVE